MDLNKLFEEVLEDENLHFIPFEDIEKGMPLYGSKNGYKFGKVIRKITDIEDLLQFAENKDDQLQFYHTLTYTPETTQAAAKYDWVVYKSFWGIDVTVYSPKKFVKLPYGPVKSGGRNSSIELPCAGCYTN